MNYTKVDLIGISQEQITLLSHLGFTETVGKDIYVNITTINVAKKKELGSILKTEDTTVIDKYWDAIKTTKKNARKTPLVVSEGALDDMKNEPVVEEENKTEDKEDKKPVENPSDDKEKDNKNNKKQEEKKMENKTEDKKKKKSPVASEIDDKDFDLKTKEEMKANLKYRNVMSYDTSKGGKRFVLSKEVEKYIDINGLSKMETALKKVSGIMRIKKSGFLFKEAHTMEEVRAKIKAGTDFTAEETKDDSQYTKSVLKDEDKRIEFADLMLDILNPNHKEYNEFEVIYDASYLKLNGAAISLERWLNGRKMTEEQTESLVSGTTFYYAIGINVYSGMPQVATITETAKTIEVKGSKPYKHISYIYNFFNIVPRRTIVLETFVEDFNKTDFIEYARTVGSTVDIDKLMSQTASEMDNESDTDVDQVKHVLNWSKIAEVIFQYDDANSQQEAKELLKTFISKNKGKISNNDSRKLFEQVVNLSDKELKENDENDNGLGTKLSEYFDELVLTEKLPEEFDAIKLFEIAGKELVKKQFTEVDIKRFVDSDSASVRISLK